MLVSTFPPALRNPAHAPSLCRACLLSLGAHGLALALIAYAGGLSPRPDGGVPQRLEVRIENRVSPSASASLQVAETTTEDGAKAAGNASIGGIVTTPPEPVGEIPLLIEGAPGAARLDMDLDANGKPTAIRVENSTLESATEQEMIERMRTVRFRPGTENGKPVASRLVLEIRVESTTR